MKKAFLFIAIIFIANNVFAQLPNTDIWLLDIVKTNDSISLQNPINITKRIGYDNQPAFSPDGKYILYTSIREDKQADIYNYNLETKKISQFTKTATSEYSPTFMPDGKNISVVMVEPDSSQRLWKFPINGGSPKLVIKSIDSIGYHCWINKDSLALIMITNPPTLEIANVNTGKFSVLAGDVGRCMYSPFAGTLYYIQKKDSTKCYMSFYKSEKNNEKPITYLLPNEDFAFAKIKVPVVFTGVKAMVYATFPFENKNKIIVDLSSLGIKSITRIAINKEGTKMAIVAE